MAHIVQFPDAESEAISLLIKNTSNAPVSTVIPQSHSISDSRIRVSRTGGVVRDRVTDSALVLVECFASTTVKAQMLAADARAIMLQAGQLSKNIRHSKEAGGISYLPDPSSGQPKYQFLIQMDLKGKTLEIGSK